MSNITRRTFVELSGAAAAVSALGLPAEVLARTPPPACNTTGMPSFLPTRLTVDCASKRNFLLFRRYPTYMGLAGVVSMSFVHGKIGSYTAGNLTLFPWLKPPGQALGPKNWGTTFPINATQYVAANPIPGWTMPLDEYYCRFVCQAPFSSFIGFRVDVPFTSVSPRRAWNTNVDKLTDGKPVGIGWTSDNMNAPWFGGSRWIPADATCNGAAWRSLIVDGLNQASAGLCS